MIRIPLRNRHGEVVAHALIDNEDAALALHRWHLDACGYVARSVRNGRVKRTLKLHREVLGLEAGDGLEGDHINTRDKLDNRRSNLRTTTHAQNAQNRPSVHGSSSRFRGVHWDKDKELWRAKTGMGGRTYHLGRFEREEDADAACREFRAQHMSHSIEATA